MKNRTYIECTGDRGCAKECSASDNWATYILTSARMKDLLSEYQYKYGSRWPSSQWYHRHARFEETKNPRHWL